MKNAQVLDRANIQFLIMDEETREQMDQLLQDTDEIAWDVLLDSTGKYFWVSDGAVVNTFATSEVPLTDYTVRAIREVLRALATSANVHREHIGGGSKELMQWWNKLVQRRKGTREVTERFYAAAAGTLHDVSAIHDLKARAAALGNELRCGPAGSESVIHYKSLTLTDYPFDPLTEPRCVTNGVYLEWGFPTPKSWQLLVALIMYEEEQAKKEKAE